MVDLEDGPDTNPVADAVDTSIPATSDAPPSPASAPASTPLEDQYDFGPPGENDPPPVAGAAPAASPEAAAVAPAAPVISDALMQRAAQIGYTPEVIATFKDPIQLEAVVRTAENVAFQAYNVARQQQAPAPVAAPVQQTLQLPPPPAAPVFDENAMRLDLAQKNFDPSLVEAIVGTAKQGHAQNLVSHQFATQNYNLMVARMRAQDDYNAKTQQYMHGQTQQFQALQAQHQRELIDRDYESFKSGLSESVQKLVNTPEARAQIMQTANMLLVGMAQTGQQLPPNSVAFKTAMYAALGEKIQQTATETVREEVKTHRARATTRPSSASGGSKAELPLGVDRAAAYLENFYRQIGMPSDSSGVEV
jgi:hypothetical protein